MDWKQGEHISDLMLTFTVYLYGMRASMAVEKIYVYFKKTTNKQTNTLRSGKVSQIYSLILTKCYFQDISDSFSVLLKIPLWGLPKKFTSNSENSFQRILPLYHQQTAQMLALSFSTGAVSSYSTGHSGASHWAVVLPGTDPEKEISLILNQSGAIYTQVITLCWLPLSVEAAVFPSRSFWEHFWLPVSVRQLHARAGQCAVSPGARGCRTAAGRSPGRPWGCPRWRLCFKCFKHPLPATLKARGGSGVLRRLSPTLQENHHHRDFRSLKIGTKIVIVK